jgi:nucleotide-binding universal stress UspA family protein
MFKRLLVPLDGSRLAEAVLPAALFFAEKFGATILLFHAIEHAARDTIHGERHLADPAEAEAYLSEIAARLTRPTTTVTKHVHTVQQANVARTIIEHAAEHQADLVVLCAHGRGGWRDMIVGNIAQQVVSRGATPVLFVRPTEDGRATQYACHRILLPLDGTPHHEPALPIAVEIARGCGAEMRVVSVVPTVSTLSAERAGAGMLLPTTMAEILELAQRGAVEYLQGVARKLSAAGVPVTAEVARGDIAPAILAAAKRADVDLYVLATHGRTTMDAFWSGSVTPKVLSQATVPVLLVRVMGEEAKR